VVPKSIWVVTVPWQTIWSAGWFTCPDGFTVIVNVFGAPGQLTPPSENIGITVIVATCGELVVLEAMKVEIVPLPLSERPIVVLVLVQI